MVSSHERGADFDILTRQLPHEICQKKLHDCDWAVIQQTVNHLVEGNGSI